MDLFDAPAQAQQPETLTVSQVTREVKMLLETQLPLFWVEGELANFKHHSSRHMYFSLRDENAQLSCVMWAGRNASVRFRPEDGMRVRARGRITLYERRGNYQLDVLELQPAGVGDLQLAFEALKARLDEEGLFDPANKQPLPLFPTRIGIVTSATGAAIRDLSAVIRRRWPIAELIIRPALVQGPGAAEDVAAAIKEFNDWGEVDVLIVGRGGGSLEDLWGFNEESVARAIAGSRLPVVSAVGHEVDFTIADFVADLRAPTPSAAAELVVPDAQEVVGLLNQKLRRALLLVTASLRHARERLRRFQQSYGMRRPQDIVSQYSQRLDDLRHRLVRAADQGVHERRQTLESARRQLQALSYRNVLARGFAVVRDAKTRRALQSVDDVKTGKEMQLVFKDGEVDNVVRREKSS